MTTAALRLLTILATVCSVVSLDTIIDLSHSLSNITLYWPGVTEFSRVVLTRGPNSAGVWLEVGAFTTGEHGGTHIDAPRHFYPDAPDLSQVPLENTVAEGVHIDAHDEAEKDPNYGLTLEKVQEWERLHGRIPDRAAVLVNFGWTSRWPDPAAYFNTQNITDVSTFRYPHVSLEAVKWLCDHRDIKMLGVDVPSPDDPRDILFHAHVVLLAQHRIIIENLKLTDSLPARGFRLHASPVGVVGGTGVQTRIYAMLHGDPNSTSRTTSTPLAYLAIATTTAMYLCFITLRTV